MPRDRGRPEVSGRCDRFDAEILPRLIAGEPPGPHVDECLDCQAALAQHNELLPALGDLHRRATPRPDWQARTMAAIANRDKVPARRRWWAWFAPLVPIVAILTLVLVWWPGKGEIGLRTEIRHVANVRAAGQPAPGDLLMVRGATAGREAELRVYRNDRELVFRCGPGAPCARERRELRGELTLPSVGRYRPVLVLDPPGGAVHASTLDADVQSLRDAGAQIELGSPIDVW